MHRDLDGELVVLLDLLVQPRPRRVLRLDAIDATDHRRDDLDDDIGIHRPDGAHDGVEPRAPLVVGHLRSPCRDLRPDAIREWDESGRLIEQRKPRVHIERPRDLHRQPGSAA